MRCLALAEPLSPLGSGCLNRLVVVVSYGMKRNRNPQRRKP
jgi:hypothetical protein